jgi:hypothetical protein
MAACNEELSLRWKSILKSPDKVSMRPMLPGLNAESSSASSETQFASRDTPHH